MAACADATDDGRPVVQSYWAPGTFKVKTFFGQHSFLDNFRRNWYSTQLCAMDEPRLSAPAGKETRIRFLWLRSFHPGISVRVERDARGARLLAVELSGAGGYAPGSVAKRLSRSLSEKEWATLEASLAAAGFWSLRTSKQSNGYDGAQWIIEVATPSRYHVVDRWGGGMLQVPGRYLLKLSGLNPTEIY
jgi:hypothetical protein